MTTPKKPRPPDHLAAPTRAWWRSVVTDYALEPHHYRILTLAAEAWDRGEMARAVLDRDGLTITDDRKNIRAHPLLAVEKDCRIGFMRAVRELDLDSEPQRTGRTGPPSLRSNSGRV